MSERYTKLHADQRPPIEGQDAKTIHYDINQFVFFQGLMVPARNY